MEVFRYITTAEQERIRKTGVLTSNKGTNIPGSLTPLGLNERPIFGLPEDPLIWGVKRTGYLLSWIRDTSRHEGSIVLIKFALDSTDPYSPFYVQDESLTLEEQARTRKHVGQYRRGEFVRPEVLIGLPILKTQITVVEFPKELAEISQQGDGIRT